MMLPELDRLRADIGLPDGTRLTADLQSMLEYAAGQFFVPHQDSEKADKMDASLVVTLPAAFTGGSLVVDHRGARPPTGRRSTRCRSSHSSPGPPRDPAGSDGY